jgi:hypothetical protein
MPELGLSGSVRGVPSNGHPYRDPGPTADVSRCNKIARHGKLGTRRNCPTELQINNRDQIEGLSSPLGAKR